MTTTLYPPCNPPSPPSSPSPKQMLTHNCYNEIVQMLHSAHQYLWNHWCTWKRKINHTKHTHNDCGTCICVVAMVCMSHNLNGTIKHRKGKTFFLPIQPTTPYKHHIRLHICLLHPHPHHIHGHNIQVHRHLFGIMHRHHTTSCITWIHYIHTAHRYIAENMHRTLHCILRRGGSPFCSQPHHYLVTLPIFSASTS